MAVARPLVVLSAGLSRRTWVSAKTGAHRPGCSALGAEVLAGAAAEVDRALGLDVLGQCGQVHQALVHRRLGLLGVGEEEHAQAVGVEQAADGRRPAVAAMALGARRTALLDPAEHHPGQLTEDPRAVFGGIGEGVAREDPRLRVALHELADQDAPPDEVRGAGGRVARDHPEGGVRPLDRGRLAQDAEAQQGRACSARGRRTRCGPGRCRGSTRSNASCGAGHRAASPAPRRALPARPGRARRRQDSPDDLHIECLAGAGLVGVDDADGVRVVDEVVDQQSGQEHRQRVHQVGVGAPGELGEERLEARGEPVEGRGFRGRVGDVGRRDDLRGVDQNARGRVPAGRAELEVEVERRPPGVVP